MISDVGMHSTITKTCLCSIIRIKNKNYIISISAIIEKLFN